jgi:chromosome partitioning protein
MDTIALITQKGGSGKTTLTLSLAVAAVLEGRTTLVIDLDMQGTSCSWNDRRKISGKGGNLIVIDAQPHRLAETLKQARANGVDFVFIDTPPRAADAALIAARAADLVIVPARPQLYDLETIPVTREILNVAGNKPAMVVLNSVPSVGERHSQSQEAVKNWQIPICPFTIGNRVAFGDAGALGLTAQEYEPKGKAAEEVQKVYKFTTHVLTELKLKEGKQKHHEHETQPDRTAG